MSREVTLRMHTLKLKKRVLKTLLMVLLAWPIAGFAQNENELLSLYFNEVRAEKYPPIPKALSLSENSKNTLEAVAPYLTDTLVDVRAKALGIVSLAGNNSRQATVRQQAVQKLIEGIKDKNTGNTGVALEYLTDFLKSDFNTAAKDSVRMLFKRKTAHYEHLVKLTGFLDLKDLVESIKPLSIQGNPRQIRWAAIITLARLQDAPSQQEMMARVKKLTLNDDVVYEVFPDLIYTRDREAINYMVELLNSDGKYCMSADAEREVAIPCGYRIMEQLAPVIKNYPLEVDESGDIKTKDYLAALASVRHWFAKHEDYEILVDRY
jgi:hypothetical protein